MLSGAISEALITTIAGLAVAVPAYAAFSYFSHLANDLVLEMERRAVMLMTRLRR
jgi:biopolymer transport protein ExbB